MQNLITRQSVKKIIKEARNKEKWTVDSKEPLRRASKLLDPHWKESEDYFYLGVTQESWKFFLYGMRPINADIFKAYCEVLKLNWEDIAEPSEIQEPAQPVAIAQIALPPAPNLNFVGREEAIANLDTLIEQGAKVIVIKAPGGVGKTTLAQEYLKSQGFDLVVEVLMAKEKENITRVESAIEELLKKDFQEEPGREFGITLGRLKRQLQIRRVGVLIDNLEPALDGQGRFIEPHRGYVELLRVLADASVQSVTLITSRQPLAECVGVTNYSLPSLNEQAWQDFLSRRDIEIDATTLREMHKAYGGNALAMNILCAPIQRDGGMLAYWQEYKVEAGLLVELAVKNLIEDQFNRLAQIYPDSYKLLCRLGCYRYQDVPTVPTEGLLCLLWDVPERQKRRVIESLRNLSLVECLNREYWLHPVIREEAISRLREREDWEEANHKAAEFWTESVKIVETIKYGLTAFEAYYHYLVFHNFDGAADVIVKRRQTKFDRSEPLGIAFYRLGLLQQMKLAIIQIITKVTPGYVLSVLHNILGDIYWLTGDIKNSIESHERSRIIASDFKLLNLEIVSFFNIGLCQIDLLEIEKGIALFDKVISMAENTDCHRYAVESYYCLAFLKSCLNLKYESLEFANKSSVPANSSVWALGYRLLFLGQTYKNLKDFDKSFEMYQEAIQFAEELQYTQVRAKALTGLAELYRGQEDFTTALSHHLESIALLDQIGAKCDLAEAYYQLGLTYQKMGVIDQSQENFDKAIELFRQMEAPKQVEKVRRAIGFEGDAVGS
ncbi:tetratricopeptide repeat protein [Microcoleus sp. bin38.metabat.b11b12b14.051]|uniref:tetratricopeptide repeat protein n=1 Tax=Microcoleus sp. bin38.metabat.b11b12b14.051 TaxID=2742709 RepID=UPI0025E471E3|nr:tetratricopeptide repeat protein [Microcoleus sp. bin38.metabat.b11b12b14.051]